MSPELIKNPVSKKQRAWLAPVVIGMMVVAILLYIPGVSSLLGPFWTLAIYDLMVIAAALLAAFLAALLWRVFERGETLSAIWGCIAVGSILWATAEIIWSYDQLWGGNSLPSPSLADVLWIIGYIPIILALGLRLYTLKIAPNKGWQIAILGLYLLFIVLLVWMIIVPIYSDPATTRVSEKIINLLYPIGDFILGLLAIALVMVLIGGTIFNSWGLIAIGFLCAAASDLLFAWSVWQGTYLNNPAEGMEPVSFVVNISYIASYILVVIGLYKQAKLNNAI
jgi:hypothetical protein